MTDYLVIALVQEAEAVLLTDGLTLMPIVNSHFTKDAAEVFIPRKQHDYGEIRVYVESQ